MGSYVDNLCQRAKFIENWIYNGPPETFWFPGFFYPQSLLTAVLQNYSRNYDIDLENLAFEHEVLNEEIFVEDGCVVGGLILDGARWEGKLQENLYKEFAFNMPNIYFKPENNSEINGNTFICPVFKNSSRAGAKGQSVNFVCEVNLKTDVDPNHWIKRGVALLCEYDDI